MPEEDILLPEPPCGRLPGDARSTKYRAIALGSSDSGLASKDDLSELSK
jgi:hypothetical protein